MKKMTFLFAASLLFGVTPLLTAASSDPCVKFEVIQGTRHDHLKWNVAPKHEARNAMTKVDLRHIEVHLSGLRSLFSYKKFVGAIDVAYGNVLDGSFRETAYSKKYGESENSHMRAKIRGDYTFDTTARFGRSFSLPYNGLFTPSLGYAFSRQHYNIRHGTISFHEDHPRYPFAPKIGKLREKMHGLDQWIRTRWQAPFIDLKFSQPLFYSLGIDIDYTCLYPMHYVGKTYANIEHIHIKDKAKDWKSVGHHAEILLKWACSKHVQIGFGGAFTQYITHGGSSKSHFYGCDSGRLKKVKRTARDYFASISYMF